MNYFIYQFSVFTNTNSAFRPAVGSLVRVAGTVVEFNTGASANTQTNTRPLTEISTIAAVTVLGTGLSVTPTTVTLPLAAGETLEKYEGMLVTLQGPLTVQQNYFQARYGQLTLGVGRHQTPTNAFRPGTPEALALADVQARASVMLDDGSSLQNPNPTPFVSSNGLPRAGDTLASLTGVIDFGLATASNTGIAMYRIHPTSAPVFTASNPRPTTAPAVGGNVKLAAANVLNYFTTFTDGTNTAGQTGQGCTQSGGTSAGNCRGANNLAEFTRQRAKLVKSLSTLNADAVGLMEIQNNGSVAIQDLVNGLNAVLGAGTYAAVTDPAEGTGDDAIKVAMIYKPGRLSRVGNAVSDLDPVNSRPTLAQTFATANGEKVTLVVNHLKSKGSCPSAGDVNADKGDGQGCWNAKRVEQAQRLRTFVAQLQNNTGVNDVLLVGDFNAYGKEDPINTMTSAGFVDQIARYNAVGYSYIFDGQSGRLDHGLSTATLSPKITGAQAWHVNADEALFYDYNKEFKAPATNCGGLCPPDLYSEDPYKSSDHDPLLVGLNLWKTILGTTGRDTLVGTAGDDVVIGGVGADTLTGGAGTNVFVYNSLNDAGDTITDFVPGKDLLDLRNVPAVAISPNTALARGVVRFAASGANTLVLLDSDGSNGPQAARTLTTLRNVSPSAIVPARDLILQ